MKNFIKQNISLVVGLLIPIVMLFVIAGVIYLPRILNTVPPPQYDFVYATGDGVNYTTSYYGGRPYTYPMKGVWPKYTYRVVSGKLTKMESGPVPKELVNMPTGEADVKFYVHHVATNKSELIPFDEAAKYTIETNIKSPDGYEVIRGDGNRSGIFPFYEGGSNYNKLYLHRDYYAQELNLQLPTDYYGDFFIGWVVK